MSSPKVVHGAPVALAVAILLDVAAVILAVTGRNWTVAAPALPGIALCGLLLLLTSQKRSGPARRR